MPDHPYDVLAKYATEALARYGKRVKRTQRHHPEAMPYEEAWTVGAKTYMIQIYTVPEIQMARWHLYMTSDGTKKLITLN